MNIRSAEPADAATVLEFFVAYAEPSLTDTADVVTGLLAHPTTRVLLAEDGNEVVGTVIAAWDGWRGSLYHLAVAATRRREGIARSLIGAAEEWLRACGCRRVNALVMDDHDYATATWRAAGYEPTPRMSRYVKMLP